MASGGSSKIPSIQDCIDKAKAYNDSAQRVLKKAKLEVEDEGDLVQNSRLVELARVAENQTFLKFDLVNIVKALEKKIVLGTSTEDLCVAIVKVAAYLADVAELLFVLQESRKKEFYAEEAVNLVKIHFTQERTIEQMQKKNEQLIESLHRKSEGSAVDDPSEEQTQLGDCEATGDNLATIYGELQSAIEEGLRQDMDASGHVLLCGIKAVQEVNGYRENHHLNLYPLFENMFIKAMDERYDRSWMHDLRRDLNNIVGRSIRVETVMGMVHTLKNACGDGVQDESQTCLQD